MIFGTILLNLIIDVGLEEGEVKAFAWSQEFGKNVLSDTYGIVSIFDVTKLKELFGNVDFESIVDGESGHEGNEIFVVHPILILLQHQENETELLNSIDLQKAIVSYYWLYNISKQHTFSFTLF